MHFGTMYPNAVFLFHSKGPFPWLYLVCEWFYCAVLTRNNESIPC